MSDISTFMSQFGFQMTEESDCVNKANASPQVASIDAHIQALLTDWHPTGFFTPAEVQRTYDILYSSVLGAGAALGAAPNSTSDAESQKKQAQADVGRKFYDRGASYLAAIAQANASGADAIDAPGLKDWVIASMRAISDAYVTAATLQCRETWLESILNSAQQAIMAVFTVVSNIAGVAVDAAKTVVKAVEGAIGFAGWLAKYGLYVAGGLGVLILAWYARDAWQKHGDLLVHGRALHDAELDEPETY